MKCVYNAQLSYTEYNITIHTEGTRGIVPLNETYTYGRDSTIIIPPDYQVISLDMMDKESEVSLSSILDGTLPIPSSQVLLSITGSRDNDSIEINRQVIELQQCLRDMGELRRFEVERILRGDGTPFYGNGVEVEFIDHDSSIPIKGSMAIVRYAIVIHPGILRKYLWALAYMRDVYTELVYHEPSIRYNFSYTSGEMKFTDIWNEDWKYNFTPVLSISSADTEFTL